jgi:hypothetical protein
MPNLPHFCFSQQLKDIGKLLAFLPSQAARQGGSKTWYCHAATPLHSCRPPKLLIPPKTNWAANHSSEACASSLKTAAGGLPNLPPNA